MGVFVEYSITVHVNNVGAVLLSENKSVSQQKNHIDVYHHFICEYVNYGIVEIRFFHSKENLADPFTNNLINVTFESLTSRYVHRE